MAGGRPQAFSSPAELAERGHAYMDRCMEDEDFVPTINELAYFLGIHRDTLHEYRRKPGYSDAIKGVLARLESWWEKRLAGNNAAGTIFWLKNQGWTDKTEQTVTGPNGEGLFQGIQVSFVRNGHG